MAATWCFRSWRNVSKGIQKAQEVLWLRVSGNHFNMIASLYEKKKLFFTNAKNESVDPK
jgi:hypothetical protein